MYYDSIRIKAPVRQNFILMMKFTAEIKLSLRSNAGFLSRPLHSRTSFVFVDQCTDLNQGDLIAFHEFGQFDSRERSRKFCLWPVSILGLAEVHSSLLV